MEISSSTLSYEFQIRKIIKNLKTNQPYNLFCHQVIADKVEDVNMAIEKIKAEGLKCAYETASRTITYVGSTDNYELAKIASYFYVVGQERTSHTILFAIPKMVKTNLGTFDYSTPKGIFGDANIDAKHSILDHTHSGIIDKEFILATLYINHKDKKYGVEENPNHMLKHGRERKLREVRERIETHVSQNSIQKRA